MTFTQKIRWYLVLVAVLPPLAVMTVLYFHSIRQLHEIEEREAYDTLRKYQRAEQGFVEELRQTVTGVSGDPSFNRALTMLRSGRVRQAVLTLDTAWLDFLEILDSKGQVILSGSRPGLLGESIPAWARYRAGDSMVVFPTTELDAAGKHAALSVLRPLGDDLTIYAGRYLEKSLVKGLRGGPGTNVEVRYISEDVPHDYLHARMEPGVVYWVDSLYYAVLMGNVEAGYYLTASFLPSGQQPLFRSIMVFTGLAAAGGMALALAIGFYITGRVKREVDNLIAVTARVAQGDLTTTVMAYEEGEFAHLADSFSDMIAKLKESQVRLATSEKIAAWQVMGRKIAHEVKNPLTPIAICADDLRRSYLERLPGFDDTLDRNTRIIRSEVDRLTRLLDQFVGFARMAPPVRQPVSVKRLTDQVIALYQSEIAAGRLVIENHSSRAEVALDPQQVTQVLINLIKNGLESSEQSKVRLEIRDQDGYLCLEVTDNGPGFSPEKLQHGFQPYLSTKRDGSGLGLVICQRIVADHGGVIELFNLEHGGAGVRLLLPGD